MNEYEQMAVDFLKLTNTTFDVIACRGEVNHFGTIMIEYYVQFTRQGEIWAFPFYMGLGHNGKEPTAYDVLACVTKYDVGTFEEFCDEFGYEEYSENYVLDLFYNGDARNKESLKIYNDVKKEFHNVWRMFGDYIEQLCEIA